MLDPAAEATPDVHSASATSMRASPVVFRVENASGATLQGLVNPCFHLLQARSSVVLLKMQPGNGKSLIDRGPWGSIKFRLLMFLLCVATKLCKIVLFISGGWGSRERQSLAYCMTDFTGTQSK